MGCSIEFLLGRGAFSFVLWEVFGQFGTSYLLSHWRFR